MLAARPPRRGARIDARRHDVRRLDWMPLADVSPALRDRRRRRRGPPFLRHHGVDWRECRRRSARCSSCDQPAARGQHDHDATGGAAAAARARTGGLRRMVAEARTGARGAGARAARGRSADPRGLSQSARLSRRAAGIGAAARLLAGKAPAGLSAPESLVLAALLPRAGRRPRSASIAARVRARASSCVQRSIAPPIRIATADTMLIAPRMRSWRHDLAPQLASELLTTPGRASASPRSTPNSSDMARDIAAQSPERLAERNVRDGAALVVDNASGEVLAYVGSAGPAVARGDVDGVQRAASGGLDAEAVPVRAGARAPLPDRRLAARRLAAQPRHRERRVHPAELRPRLQGPRQRAHRARQFAQRAGGAHAGARRRRGVPRAAARARLQRTSPQDGDYYGYSLALGSAEVSLWQLAHAYRSARPRRTMVAAAPSPRPSAPPSTRSALLAPPTPAFVVERHPRATGGAQRDVRPRQSSGHAVLERGQDRHQQGHARQLVRRLLAALHGRASGSAISTATRCAMSAASRARPRSGTTS